MTRIQILSSFLLLEKLNSAELILNSQELQGSSDSHNRGQSKIRLWPFNALCVQCLRSQWVCSVWRSSIGVMNKESASVSFSLSLSLSLSFFFPFCRLNSHIMNELIYHLEFIIRKHGVSRLLMFATFSTPKSAHFITLSRDR